MPQITVLQILGLILFLIVGVCLLALQLEKYDKYRIPIFITCIASFIGTGIIGYLAYVPTPIIEAEILYDEGKGGGGGGSGGSGSGGGGGGGKKGGSGGSGSSGGSGGGGGDGGSGDDTEDGGNAVRDDEQEPGSIFSDCSRCPQMIVIPKGANLLGTPKSQTGRPDNEKPQRNVNLYENFAVSQTEITVGDFKSFVEDTGYIIEGSCNTDGVGGPKANYRSPAMQQDDTHPVVCVSFIDAQAYTSWLAKITDKSYRLLSEVEWEYTRRGARSLEEAKAPLDGPPESGNIKADNWVASTTAAETFDANAFMVFDMMGNAAEWTIDCWQENHDFLPASGAPRTASGDCLARAVRGGSWDDTASKTRPASRKRVASTQRDWRIGIRVMRPMRRKDEAKDGTTVTTEQ